MRASTTSLLTSLSPNTLVVGVFIGATKGIGSGAVLHFAQLTPRPRAYIVGRSQADGERIVSECRSRNPKGEYVFLRADASSLKAVDDVCREIVAREKEGIHLLFQSQGTLDTKSVTDEGLNLGNVLAYYSRVRFIQNLLPLLQQSKGSAAAPPPEWAPRVVNVWAGTKEGAVNTADLEGSKFRSPNSLRGHFATMITFALEELARGAPDVGFVHAFPGFVKTDLLDTIPGLVGAVARPVLGLVAKVTGGGMSLGESGVRSMFVATSARYPPREGGVAAAKGDVCVGSDGQVGSGVYTVDENGESASAKVLKVLADQRKEGVQERVWENTMAVLKRVTGTEKI